MPPTKKRKEEDVYWKLHCASKKPAKEDRNNAKCILYRLERSPIFAAIVSILEKDTRSS